jgi:IS5 family transposase
MAQLSFLDVDNRLAALSADNPLRSAKGGTKLKARGFRSRIHGRGSGSNHPLSPSQRKPTAKGKGPAAVSSTSSGAQENTQGGGGGVVRTLGVVRARAKIGLQNLRDDTRAWRS